MVQHTNGQLLANVSPLPLHRWSEALHGVSRSPGVHFGGQVHYLKITVIGVAKF